MRERTATKGNKRGPPHRWRRRRVLDTLGDVSIRRFIKASVTPAAKTEVERLGEVLGMKEITMMSRLIMWFADLDDVSQREVMGLLPPSMADDIKRLALKRLGSRKRRGGK